MAETAVESAGPSGRQRSRPVVPEAQFLFAALQGGTRKLGEFVELSAALQNPLTSAAEVKALIGKVAEQTIPRWHFAMLNDTERCDAFAVALEKSIRPGMHVLDLGSGTGLLAMMAARAGAAQVTTCEANPLLAEIARRIVEDHGMSEVITVIPKMSTTLHVGRDIAAPADLIVSEIVDCGLIGEGLLSTLRHARDQLLAPGGLLIPKAAGLRGALMESKAIRDLNRVDQASGFDVSLFNATATTGHFPVRTATWPHRLLGEDVKLIHFDFVRDSLADGTRTVHLPVTTSGTAHGVMAWFEMDLGGGVVVRTSPDNVGSHWMQAFVSFRDPVPVTAGTPLEVVFSWQGTRLHAEHGTGSTGSSDGHLEALSAEADR